MENEERYGTLKKLVRNSKNSKFDTFKNVSVLVQILTFL